MKSSVEYQEFRKRRIVVNGLAIGFTLFAVMPLSYFAILRHWTFFTDFEYYCLVGLYPLGAVLMALELRSKSQSVAFSFKHIFALSFIMCLIATITWAVLSTLYVTIIDPDFAEKFVGALSREMQWEWTPAESNLVPFGYMLILSPIGQSVLKIGLGVIWSLIVSLGVGLSLKRRVRVGTIPTVANTAAANTQRNDVG